MSSSNTPQDPAAIKPTLILDVEPRFTQILWRLHYSLDKKGVIKIPMYGFTSHDLLRTYMHSLFKLNRGKKVFEYQDMTTSITPEQATWLAEDMNRRIYYRSQIMLYDVPSGG